MEGRCAARDANGWSRAPLHLGQEIRPLEEGGDAIVGFVHGSQTATNPTSGKQLVQMLVADLVRLL